MAESALTGDDVIAEVIVSNDRLQSGIRVGEGGVVQSSANVKNDQVVPAQEAIDKYSDRLTESEAVRHG